MRDERTRKFGIHFRIHLIFVCIEFNQKCCMCAKSHLTTLLRNERNVLAKVVPRFDPLTTLSVGEKRTPLKVMTESLVAVFYNVYIFSHFFMVSLCFLPLLC